MDSQLPKYNKPPVIEVALSVQFERLNVATAQFGLLWVQFRDRFPKLQEKPELDAIVEKFGSPKPIIPDVRFEMGAVPAPRLWFVSESNCDLVQVQRDRFIRNWRKTEDKPDYPSYEKLRGMFAKDWECFAQFVADEINAPLTPNQCEVTYVNILEGFKPSDMPKLCTWVSGGTSDGYLGEPESVDLALRYQLKDENNQPWGRLHIVAAPAMRAADSTPVIRLAMTARGAPVTNDIEGLMNCMDNEHAAVVRGFTSITTPAMHAAWERTT